MLSEIIIRLRATDGQHFSLRHAERLRVILPDMFGTCQDVRYIFIDLLKLSKKLRRELRGPAELFKRTHAVPELHHRRLRRDVHVGHGHEIII